MIDIISYVEGVISEMSQKFDILEVKQTYTPEFYRRYIRLLSALVNLIDEAGEDEEEDLENEEDEEEGNDSESEGENDETENEEEEDSSSSEASPED